MHSSLFKTEPAAQASPPTPSKPADKVEVVVDVEVEVKVAAPTTEQPKALGKFVYKPSADEKPSGCCRFCCIS